MHVPQPTHSAGARRKSPPRAWRVACACGTNGREAAVYRMKDGMIMIVCYREHLDGLKRFVELADAIEKWLEETER